VFDGGGMFVRVKGAKNSNDMVREFTWGGVLTCNTAGGGLGADCNGYPQNAFRYDSPTWAGFSMSTSYGEDDMWDIALKYAADWNMFKVSAAAGWTQLTDEGCSAFGAFHGGRTCSNVAVVGGGGTPFQNFRQDGQLFQIGASILHVPSGLFAYGLFQNDQEEGTQFKSLRFNGNPLITPNFKTRVVDSDANESNTWFVKAGIKKAWMPAGATVIFGEWGRYDDMFRGLCGNGPASLNQPGTFCITNLPIGVVGSGRFKGQAITASSEVTGSEVQRWGVGVVQEIDSAAMHLFARWQHMDLDLDAIDLRNTRVNSNGVLSVNNNFGKGLNTSFEGLDIFQVGGVIFF
jgi:hypothetical protein